MGDGKDCLPGMRAVEASMPGKSKLTADAAEQAALRALSKSEQRDEADPARRAGDFAAVAGAPTVPKGFAWRRPRHTLKGRQDAATVEASRQHLADLKTPAAAGAIDLVFLDESEALTHPYLARCWARRGSDLRIQAPAQAKKQAMLGAFDPVRRHLLVQ